MKKFILITSVLFFTLSCSSGLYNEISRLIGDPQISTPNVVSFSEVSTIDISWDYDSLADEYILYRALDNGVLNFTEIYRGSDTEYTDTDGNEGDIYHYSLSKSRGSKEFDLSSSVLGVMSQTQRDELESNDTKATATLLTFDLTSNMYGFQDTNGSQLIDEDWFYIKIPPRRTAFVVITQLAPVPAGGTDTHFYYYLEGNPIATVVNNSEIQISNYLFEEEDVYFKIFPNPAKYFPNPVSGGTIVSYKISLKKIGSL